MAAVGSVVSADGLLGFGTRLCRISAVSLLESHIPHCASSEVLGPNGTNPKGC